MNPENVKAMRAHLRRVRALEDMVISVKHPPKYCEAIALMADISYSPRGGIPCPRNPSYWPEKFDEKGVYSVVTEELVEAIKAELEKRNLLSARIIEVCAGRGLLSHFLRKQGVGITATDNYRCKMHRLPSVERMGYMAALKRFQPEVVLAFWPCSAMRLGERVLGFPSVNYLLVADENDSALIQGKSPFTGFEMNKLPSVERFLICNSDRFEHGRYDLPVVELKCSEAVLYQRLALTSTPSLPKS